MGALSRGPKGRLWGASAAALFCLSLSLAASTRPAEADKVGVAAAVNPDAFSSLSGSPQSQLSIGKSIFFNERINTTTSGLVQVLLVDGSTFTVGPGSDLVIDKFIYDPKKQTGQIVASMSKGVMRFVGGKISKNDDAVKVNTPAGALAIRGGMFQAQVNGTKIVASFLYGKQLTLGSKYTVYEPGYTIDTTSGAPTIRPTTTADINTIMASLTNGSTSGLGSSGDQTPPTNPSDTQGLSQTETDIVNDSTQTQIQDTVQKQQNQPQPQLTGNDTPPPCTGNACNPPPPPTPITLRVVAAPSSHTAYGQSIADPLQHGILGGDDNPNVTVDDFSTDDLTNTFQLQNGRLTGTVDGLRDSCSGVGCDPDGTKPNIPAQWNLPWTFPESQCAEPGVCLVSDATVKQGTDATTYFGTAVHKPGFFAYHLAAVDNTNPNDTHLADHVLLFGGETYQFTQPNGTVYSFDLTPDVLQTGAAPPFASLESMPRNGAAATITPLLMLEDGDHTVWLQASFYLERNADGTLVTGNQDSFINIALGGMSEDGGLIGMRRGGSHLDIVPCNGNECGGAQRQSLAFTGDIATLAGPGDASHFMGADNPNIVIGFDSTGEDHNIGRDIPLNPISGYNDTVQNQAGSTYHIGVGSGTVDVGDQNNTPLKGYAAGLAQQFSGGAPHILGNVSAEDISLYFDSEANTMSASLHLGDGVLQNPKYNLEFGGEGRSAFIDDDLFAAVEQPGGQPDGPAGSSVDEIVRSGFLGLKKTPYNYPADVQAYIVSADAISANEALFTGQTVPVDPDDPDNLAEEPKKAFCQSCDFLKWGAWGARVAYTDHAGRTIRNDVHLGWWIAGDVVPSASDMPKTGSANYAGDAIGTVNNNGQQYTATGDMSMSWNFGLRSGKLQISDFDNRDFVGLMVAPGRVQFSGPLVGAGGLIGQANGAFVGANHAVPTVAPSAPSGVIGNFGIGNSNYQATGIFGGGLKP